MKQIRFIPTSDCGLQVREPQDGQTESRMVVGKPIIFGVRSVNLTPWSKERKVYEILEPGCISSELLQRSDVILNINHSNKVTDVLGRWNRGKGTLDLQLKPRHIESACEVANTTAANDTLVLINRGDITGMSFAFEDDWEDTENGVSLERTEEIEDGKEVWLRHVKRITALYDVSIVTYPAYEQTSVGTREQGDAILKQIDAQIAAAAGETDEQKREREEREAEEQRKAREEAERKEREAEEQRKESEMTARTQHLRERRRRIALESDTIY